MSGWLVGPVGRGAALIGAAVLVMGTATPRALAASPGTWTGDAHLSATASTAGARAVGDPAGGSVLFYVLNGIPAVAPVAASGKIGKSVDVPSVSGLNDVGTPGPVAFLTSGSAVFTWTLSTYGTEYMAYRSTSGVWGKPVLLPSGYSNLAVRTHEVLTSESSGTGVSVESWTLSASGGLTLASGPTNIYTGQPLFNTSWLSLDPKGTAELVVYGSTDEGNTESLQGVTRGATGTWSTQLPISNPGQYVSAAHFAAAPGGRAILTWVISNTYFAADSFTAIRRVGHPFGAPVGTGSVSDANGAAILVAAAAGPDGTLAAAVTERLYASNGIAFTDSTDIYRSGPTASVLSGPVGDPEAVYPQSLGAGATSIIVGSVISTYGTGNSSYPSSYTDTQQVFVTIIGTGIAHSKLLGASSGLYDGNGGDGCPCATSPPATSISGVSLDSAGNALALGAAHARRRTRGGTLHRGRHVTRGGPDLRLEFLELTYGDGRGWSLP